MSAETASIPDQVNGSHDVLTLDELATYLRLSREVVERQARAGVLPGREIDGQWRFLKATINHWLGQRDTRAVLLSHAGVFKDDETLPQMLADVYRRRGRPEAEAEPTKKSASKKKRAKPKSKSRKAG